jgi:hypothetical protein
MVLGGILMTSKKDEPVRARRVQTVLIAYSDISLLINKNGGFRFFGILEIKNGLF